MLGPGTHFKPFVNIVYDYKAFPVINIPENFYGQIVAKDGQPLPEGTFIAPEFKEAEAAKMLDAKYFLEHGGYRGPQVSVLEPGSYRLNHYLFDVKVGDHISNSGKNDDDTLATIIPAGFVGVVKSNIGDKEACREEKAKTAPADGALAVNLVPRGCVGIWKDTFFLVPIT